jgi:hypothetical protein
MPVRYAYAAAVVLAGTALCQASPCPATESPSDTLVFIGERVSIEEAPDPCDEHFARIGTRNCISMDSLFSARYSVIEPIVGKPADEAIRFQIADHYGFPAFARFRYALLFVAQAKEDAWLHKYQGIPLHETVDGQWASCGDIRRDPSARASPQLRALRFKQEIAHEADLPDYMLESYRAGERPYWRIERGKVWCSQGMLVEDVYEVVRTGVMRARGIPLPAWSERRASGDRTAD